MPKLLHIAQDEKFIEAANKQFQLIFPDSNDFFIITANVDDYRLKHVKKHPNFSLFRENNESHKFILSQLHKYDLIVLHNLDFFKSKVVLNSDKPFLWLYWGFEIYNSNMHIKKVLGPKTLQLRHKLRKVSLKSKAFVCLFMLREGRLNMNKSINRAVRKIQYFGSGIKEEFDLLKSQNIIHASYFDFSYYNLESYIPGKSSVEKKNKILLGNSATVTNNHLEAFDILHQLNDVEIQIITPLNYGDMDYAKEISDTGTKLFGDRFTALTDFLPLDDYNKLLNECGIFIMNSYRQQALGNIYTLLYMGAKVYLDERNLAYKFLKRVGAIVFSINKELIPGNPEALNLLNEEQRRINRAVIEKEFGMATMNSKIKAQLIDLLKI
jgi:hypothetical protein